MRPGAQRLAVDCRSVLGAHLDAIYVERIGLSVLGAGDLASLLQPRDQVTDEASVFGAHLRLYLVLQNSRLRGDDFANGVEEVDGDEMPLGISAVFLKMIEFRY